MKRKTQRRWQEPWKQRGSVSSSNRIIWGRWHQFWDYRQYFSFPFFHSPQNRDLYLFDTQSSLLSFTNTKGCTCQQRNRIHAPKHFFTRTRAHTRGRLRCWQHSGMTPLFIWLLRKKSVRKHSSVTTWTSWEDDPLTDWYLTECWLFVCSELVSEERGKGNTFREHIKVLFCVWTLLVLIFFCKNTPTSGLAACVYFT